MLLKTYHKFLIAIAKGIHGNNIYHLCKLYRDIVSKKQDHHGRKTMVLYMKELNSIAERYSMYQPIEPIKFLKSDADGFPNVLAPFKASLRNDNPNEVKISLSIFRSCELFRLPPHHDISTVVRQPTYDNKVVEDIIQYIPKFIQKLSTLQYKNLIYHYTVKNGPNGPALATSDKDLSAVRQDVDIYDAIKVVSAKLNDLDLPVETYLTPQSGIHSRLTQFSEKAGKTRTIAVVDYYSQRALFPLHKGLMSLLRKISSDGTFSHRNVGNYAKEATKNKTFIATSDMTAFTDLFPSVLQHQLLLQLVEDQDLAEAWWTLLAKRNFRVAWSGDYITYGTGQPMGAYASWPLCTLAHHLVMHYSAYKCSIKNVNKYYRILGDDNERVNETLSTYYEETLSNLGCELNPSKGTCSQPGVLKSSAEVAKRLYLNGIDISPITPGIVNDLLNPALINNALKEFNEIFDIPTLPVHILDTVIKETHREKAWILCTNPFTGVIKPGFPGYEDHTELWCDLSESDLQTAMIAFRLKSLADKVNAIDDKIDLFFMNMVPLTRIPMVNKNIGVEGDMELISGPQFAQTLSQRQMLKRLKNVIDKLQYEEVNSNFLILDEVEYLPDPQNPFLDSKDVRNTQATLLVERVYTLLKAGEDPTELLSVVTNGLDSPF